ncbi:MAG: bifunctional glutamate N-acetyltransferase/amino-acid acetyltransferase ArgJ [Robiginitomaculum sp.]|nr:bifunctional glutamate N-acetyltransferase/amino-acid acetyltransferase ArgJ [Robiginitomaculum sp.]
MYLKRSPLAPAQFPSIPALAGIEMWSAETGAKYKNRPDVLLVKFAKPANVAGVFTKSSTPGAPVEWSRDCLKRGANSGLLVSAGNANVFTGRRGAEDVVKMAGFAAGALDCSPEDVYICSTGVIGEPLDLGPFEKLFVRNSFMRSQTSWEQAAQAITTTDTYTKGALQICEIDGTNVTICGIAKGSGMIAPDMATMLSFIFTDANISQDILQALLTDICETSFNAITVDSDTSTSDTVLLVATGGAAHKQITELNDPKLAPFKSALRVLMLDLAHQVVRDGEGASKFFAVHVTGAENDKAAKTIAMSIANSPLVKTAIAGEDANWGRIVMAVGKSGEKAVRDKLTISFGPHLVASNGFRAPGYDEDILSTYMRNSELEISVDVGVSTGAFTVWSCDLTHGYIDINADYRS